jgi:hypothetical protein
VDEAGEGCFEAAVRACILAGGCCASRASFVGACVGARLGVAAVPQEWIAQTLRGEEVTRLAAELAAMRGGGGAQAAAAAPVPSVAPPVAAGGTAVDGSDWKPSL